MGTSSRLIAGVGLWAALLAGQENSPIRFSYHPLPVTLETSERLEGKRFTPATMAGGVAAFDYDNDGGLDLFFTNGASMPDLVKTGAKFWNRLLANDGNGQFTDVTEQSGLAGAGYDSGVAIADYDNDGDQDLFLAGVHRNDLYRNNGDGTYSVVTEEAGLAVVDSEYGPLWAVAGVWFDYDNDGWLDLFVVNYLRWSMDREPICTGYCHPKHYDGLPNRLFRNRGDGTFEDVSGESGIRGHVGKGMGAAAADFDGDGDQDIFVSNDKTFNFLFRNNGSGKFEEIAFEAGVALAEHGMEISGMGTDFRDFDNDAWPDIAIVALDNETFPLFRNNGRGAFVEVTNRSGLASQAREMAGYGPVLADFDNDGWKDLFVSRGHVQGPDMKNQWVIEQHNTVFRNLGNGRLRAYTAEAGFAAGPRRRHRGVAYGDFNGDGRLDLVVTAINAGAELWINESPGEAHWIAVRLVGRASNRDGVGARVEVVAGGQRQHNHFATSSGYASASAGPLHFGLGSAVKVDAIEVMWPSGKVTTIEDVAANQVVVIRE